MAQQHERLRSLAAELQVEVRAVESLDDQTREQLETLATEIIQALHRNETGEGSDSGSLRDRLVEFEASHPNLAVVVNRLIDMLGQMGI
jgi:prefoldin subunit 5